MDVSANSDNVFDDIDVEHLQDLRNREMLLRQKLKILRKKYFEKVTMIKALNARLLDSQEFQEVKKELYLNQLREDADNLLNYNDLLQYKEKENLILTELDNENGKLINTRHNEMSNEASDKKDKENNGRNNYSIEKESLFSNFIRCIIDVFLSMVPFKSKMEYLNRRYNLTIDILFNIIRLFIVVSLFNYLIFLFLWIYHLIRVENKSEKCKYGFPCFFFYSSFNYAKIGDHYSLTYGTYIIFMMFFFFAFYFYYHSYISKIVPYVKTNRSNLLSAYFFTSWDFNTKERIKAKYEKQLILDQCKNYLETYSDEMTMGISEKNGCGKVIVLIASYILFIVYLFGTFIVIVLILYLRQGLRKAEQLKAGSYVRDLFCDLFVLFLLACVTILFPFITEFFALIERWTDRKSEAISTFIKKTLMVIGIIGFVLAIQTKFTIDRKELKEQLLFVNLVGISSFSCPGKNYTSEDYFIYEPIDLFYHSPYPIFEIDNNTYNFTPSQFINEIDYNRKGYSRCAEDELSLNFFFWFLFYICIYYIKEVIFIYLNTSGKIATEPFSPFNTIIHIFTELILLSIASFFCPYCFFLFPIVFIIDFLYNYKKLKIYGTISYDEITVENRNNAHLINLSFLIFSLVHFIIILYFYFGKFKHREQMNCVLYENDNTTSNRLLSDYTEFNPYRFLKEEKTFELSYMKRMEGEMCGPFAYNERIGDAFNIKFTKTKVMRNLYEGGLSNSVFIIILFIIIITSILFKDNSPTGEYYSYIVQRHGDLLSHFHLIHEHLLKRDVITGILLRINRAKKPSKSEKEVMDNYNKKNN